MTIKKYNSIFNNFHRYQKKQISYKVHNLICKEKFVDYIHLISKFFKSNWQVVALNLLLNEKLLLVTLIILAMTN